MRKCKICKKPFPWGITINGHRYNLQSRTSCLECIPFKSIKQKANRNSPELTIKKCSRHGEVEHKLEYHGRNHGFRYRCSECLKSYSKTHQEQISKYRKEIKLKAIEYKGGKCEICGYNKCIQALEFHHKNPDEKEFGICDGNTRSFKRIKIELDKCILLCSNCHREIHIDP